MAPCRVRLFPPRHVNALREEVGDYVGCGETHGAWEQAIIPIPKKGRGVRDHVRWWDEVRVAAIVGFDAKAATLLGVLATTTAPPIPDTSELMTHFFAGLCILLCVIIFSNSKNQISHSKSCNF